MNPHPRKDNPPRREPGSGSDEGLGHPEEAFGDSYAEMPPQTEGISYDPGAALVEEGGGYGYPGPEAAYPSAGDYQDPAGSHGYADSPGASGDPYASGDGGLSDLPPPPPPVSRTAYGQSAPVPSRTAGPSRGRGSQRPPVRRPVAGSQAPGSRRVPPRPVYGGGVSVMTVFLSLIAIAMLAGVAMVILPKDMENVAGHPIDPLSTEKPKNLLDEVQKIMIERKTALTFSEEEVNRYLNARVRGEQKGAMAALVKFRAVYVDFQPGTAEILIERELFGMPMTVGAQIGTDKFRNQTVFKPVGWSLGRVELGKHNVKPVVDLFIRLRGTLLDEYHALQQMVEVRFEENQVVLDSRI